MNETVYKEVVRLLGEIAYAEKMMNKNVDKYMETGNKENFDDWKSFKSYAVGLANKVQGMLFAVEAIEGIQVSYYFNDKKIYLYQDGKVVWERAIIL